jgi:hypothetical protein
MSELDDESNRFLIKFGEMTYLHPPFAARISDEVYLKPETRQRFIMMAHTIVYSCLAMLDGGMKPPILPEGIILTFGNRYDPVDITLIVDAFNATYVRMN